MPIKTILKTVPLAAMLALPLAPPAHSADSVKIGVLNCNVSGGSGFIFGSTKNLTCEFDPAGNSPAETYSGTINKYGVDVGTTEQGVISWAVFAPTADYVSAGALDGTYGGVSAEATVGAGLGANVLVGGSDKSIALQPFSVSAQTGLNFALAVSQLDLRAM